MNEIRVGIDIGSTTAKAIAIDAAGTILFTRYGRHNAKAREAITDILRELQLKFGDLDASIRLTGSVGMGFSEQLKLPFVQEVVAAAKAIQRNHPCTTSMIDIGGEDAKVVFFKDAEATDLRMNGNCAGGTGAFIDQMAVILGVDIGQLNELALHATQIYPIASRCGVFCKTDIQNLIAKNVSRENIAASIFHAVAVQTVVTLAHGCELKTPILFCGGPLTFIPALRNAFTEYLHLSDTDIILPENGTLLPALGTALAEVEHESFCKLSRLIGELEEQETIQRHASGLKPIFSGPEEHKDWQNRISRHEIQTVPFRNGKQDVFIGIDSGSTTTKIVVTDTEARILYAYYQVNGGNPVEAVETGLQQLQEECLRHGTVLNIQGSCSTGYGEDLIRTAFQLDSGIVETIAHYMAACHLNKSVSFILDIGGQDMKAMFVSKGVIDRIEINEACSSGCGSFIETFAKTLGYTAQDFSQAACHSSQPCDLGTRCTVFMNSKVKQVLREGATVDDIAAGLAYSVVKNCLYKVLKLKDTAILGEHIVVQGGTMRNDAIVRALELLTGTEVTRCNIPELMGAFGCALYARQHGRSSALLSDLISQAHYTSRSLHCKGCNNRCLVSRYHFDNGKDYYSGNRCEKVFNNGKSSKPGSNAYPIKNELLFGRIRQETEKPRMTVGIPRCLNMYESFPFWHTLLTACRIRVCLSDPSDFAHYEQNARMVMSDNICFPAKLVHSHIQNLIEKKVDRIFMPFVIYEKQEKEQNSYNCPIVTGYSEVIRSVQSAGIPIDSPAISFKDRNLLYKQCRAYLSKLGICPKEAQRAFALAEKEQAAYIHTLAASNKKILEKARQEGHTVVLLAGRPYHTDALIQHNLADLIANMGIDVITEDISREERQEIKDVHFLSQWSYPNRILRAAQWCSEQKEPVPFIEMTSFGCGPDAFLADEVRELLMRHGKAFTLLKLDDIHNAGSMKLRIRSLMESLKLAQEKHRKKTEATPFRTVPIYKESLYNRKILVPYFTPFLSPLIPAIMRTAGYNVESLPLSDEESCEWGLKYANNEVCYPATLIVGDIIKAFKSGRHDPDKTAIAMTQTGGQCRASNYISLIRKALIDAGYENTPVISLTFGEKVEDNQPGFKINWIRMLPMIFRTILYGDCISKFYYASAVREKEQGAAARLRDKYLHTAEELITKGETSHLFSRLHLAAEEFNGICKEMHCPRVGIVGEIFLKFNPFAHKHITDWLTEKGIEVVPSILTDFFMQSFVNRKARVRSCIQEPVLPEFVLQWGYRIIWKQIEKVNRIAGNFRYFTPFEDIFEKAERAQKIISLNAQFGEGWLLPAEMISYAQQGVNNVISLQPFGCIANHIVSKGIEKRIKSFFPELNILSLDFDSGVSNVNITNRILLFIDKLKKQ